jgi:hypothetical protein
MSAFSVIVLQNLEAFANGTSSGDGNPFRGKLIAQNRCFGEFRLAVGV